MASGPQQQQQSAQVSEMQVRCESHSSRLLEICEKFLTSESQVDVTLASEGQTLKAHQLILSAASPFFEEMFKLPDHKRDKYPVVYLHGISFKHLKSIVEFMYSGEITIYQDDLPTLLSVADSLHVRGLSGVSQTQQEPPSTPQEHEKLGQEEAEETGLSDQGSNEYDIAFNHPAVSTVIGAIPQEIPAGSTVTVTGSASTLRNPFIGTTKELASFTVGTTSAASQGPVVNSEKQMVLHQYEIPQFDAVAVSTKTEAASMIELDDESDVIVPSNENNIQPGYSVSGYGLSTWMSNVSSVTVSESGQLQVEHRFRPPLLVDPIPNTAASFRGKKIEKSQSRKRKVLQQASEKERVRLHQCYKCSRLYKTRGSLKRHLQFECNVDPQFECNFCGLKIRHLHNKRHHEEICNSKRRNETTVTPLPLPGPARTNASS